MALTGSGQISFNDVRVEVSQSAKTDYAFGEWAWGYNNFWEGGNYAPINVLSSGSRFSESSPLQLSNLSMSAWYSYDHTPSIGTGITGTLYQHADVTIQCYPSTMLIVNIGTSNTTYSINISGSGNGGESIQVYYGKPWNNTGASGTGSATFITSSIFTSSFNYNYTYNANSGSNLYFVMLGGCP
jgi:hypothetical protein